MQKLVFISTLAFSLTLIVFACSKDKFESTPSIEIKSITPNPLPVNGSLVIDLEYTDKEGDIADSIFIRKIRINQKKVARTLRDSFAYQIPSDVPKKSKGTIRITLNYDAAYSAENPGTPPAPDSLIFRFALQDKAKHLSDTAESGLVIINR